MNRWLGGIFCFGFDTDDTDFIVKLDLNKEIIYSGQSSWLSQTLTQWVLHA